MRKKVKNHYKFALRLFLFFLLFAVGFFFLNRNFRYIQDSPYDVVVSDVTSSSVILSWRTATEVPTYVLIDDTLLIGDGEWEKYHRVEISDLEKTKAYSFTISDGTREWNETLREGTDILTKYVVDEFKFKTVGEVDNIILPKESYLTVLPNELVYVVLYDTKEGTYSDIRSGYANRYGGVVFDKGDFNVENADDYSLKNINYFSSNKAVTKNLISKVFSSEINCNQSIPNMTSNAISRDSYTDLATRWVSGRGKNYAYECYNDTIYRAKVAGVDPAFALTIWLNESGASNYTFNPDIAGLIEDFGIHGLSTVPMQDYNAQINHFLTLTHKVTCEGLTAWEAWGNIYKWGSCNEDDPIKREDGIAYYKQIEMVYGWVTNGLKLPSVVTGLPKMPPLEEEEEEEVLINPKCCAIKLDNRESFKGDFENETSGGSCSDIWKVGRQVFDGTIEYVVEIPNKSDRVACEIDYEGACCKLSNGLKWYPKVLCTDILPGITDSKSCNTYTGEKACFLRDGRYQWLASVIGTDNIKSISSESACLAMNDTESVEINLKEGVNFIGLDFVPVYMGSNLKASNLLAQYPDIHLIANFGNNKWEKILVRADSVPYAGDDFTLEQSKGYLINVKKDITISLGGWLNPTIEYYPVNRGWNLVGGELYSKSLTASKLISDLKGNSIDIDTVSVWSYELGSFIFRSEEDGDIYGDDFSLNDSIGIFLKQNL
ncbi:MAG: hypothetical protein RBS01_03095 [Candidatus Dojkabacteria bacterium]|jgi:hypothetical protein|nr:hypothetical protein [Candidatus Dojkabacteria bacterium]